MRRAVRGSWCVLLVPIFLAQGCGPELPPPPVLKGTQDAEQGGAKSVFMVVPGPPNPDVEFWAIAGQREAGDTQAVFRVLGPGPSDPQNDQAWYVRKAVEDGASALVVVAGDNPNLPAALAEAQAKKVPVVLIGKPVDPPAGAPAFTRVRPGSFDPPARKIVETSLADAKELGLPADAAAIIMVDKNGDLFSADRVAALKKAAEAAGIKKVVVVPFEPVGEGSKTSLLAALKENPDVVHIFCDDDEAMLGASRARIELDRKPTILVGGFAGSRGLWEPAYFMNESSFVECRNEKLAKLAIWAALARARGELKDDLVELEPKFNRGRGASPSSWGGPKFPTAQPEPEAPPDRRPVRK